MAACFVPTRSTAAILEQSVHSIFCSACDTVLVLNLARIEQQTLQWPAVTHELAIILLLFAMLPAAQAWHP